MIAYVLSGDNEGKEIINTLFNPDSFINPHLEKIEIFPRPELPYKPLAIKNELVADAFVEAQEMLADDKMPHTILTACRTVLEKPFLELGKTENEALYQAIERLRKDGRITEELFQWAHLIRQLGNRGGVAKDNRLFINAAFWIFGTGAPWRDLPPDYAYWSNVHCRFLRWRNKGIWEKILAALIDKPHFEWLMIDTGHCKIHPDAAGVRGGNQAMERTKGSLYKDTWGRVLPEVRSANCQEGRTVPVERPHQDIVRGIIRP